MSRSESQGIELRFTPRYLAALGLVVVLTASGCGSRVEQPAADPGGTTDVSTTAPAGQVGQQAELPPGRIVWQVNIGGGFVPFAVAANDVPEVTIYGDGRIFVPVPVEELDLPAWRVPAAVELSLGSVPPEELQTFLDDVASSGLIDESVDYGDPPVSDLPGTSVLVDWRSGPTEINVRGLQDGFDDGFDSSQLEVRRKLEDLIERSRNLGNQPEPWVPDRVEATGLTLDAGPPSDGTTPWPGPPFVDLFGTTKPNDTDDEPRCAELDGDGAAAVFAAAVGSGKPFIDERGAELHVVVRALLPGEEACDGL